MCLIPFFSCLKDNPFPKLAKPLQCLCYSNLRVHLRIPSSPPPPQLILTKLLFLPTTSSAHPHTAPLPPTTFSAHPLSSRAPLPPQHLSSPHPYLYPLCLSNTSSSSCLFIVYISLKKNTTSFTITPTIFFVCHWNRFIREMPYQTRI